MMYIGISDTLILYIGSNIGYIWALILNTNNVIGSKFLVAAVVLLAVNSIVHHYIKDQYSHNSAPLHRDVSEVYGNNLK